MKAYPLIRAWHSFTGSFDYYVQEQVRQAEETKAPQDAIFRDVSTGGWKQYRDIKDDDLKIRIAHAAAFHGVDPKRLVADGVLSSRTS